MTPDKAVIKDRRGQSRQKIQSLVAARTATLTLYAKLADMKPFPDKLEAQKLVQRFCQALVDYTAGAHFILYRYIDEKTERRRPVLDVADQIYPRIVDITQYILDFNDKYDCEDHCDSLGSLAGDLSKLGEALADRIELEDSLIAVLQER